MLGPQGNWIIGWIDASAMNCLGDDSTNPPPAPAPAPAVTAHAEVTPETPAQPSGLSTANQGTIANVNIPAQAKAAVTSAVVSGAIGH